MVGQIYPNELQLNNANSSETEAPFLDLNLSITNDIHSSEIHDKRDVCICSLYCCTLLYVHSSIAIILMGKRELIALLNLSSWCLVMVERLFLTVPRGCMQFVIVVFPDHTHLLFMVLILK